MRMIGWSGRVAALTLSAGALVVAPAIAARKVNAVNSIGPEYTPVGSLTYSWTGDPARGCAGTGLCGVTGSLTIRVGNSSSAGSGPPQFDLQDDAVTVRSETPPTSGGSAVVCAAQESVALTLTPRRVAGTLRAVALDPFGPSSAQCPGPTSGDLGQLSLPARRLRNGSYDLGGNETFGAGPFTVVVRSSIRVNASRQSRIPGFIPAPPPVIGGGKVVFRRALVEQASVDYRITGVRGSLGVSFGGIGDPFCEPLGTCGAEGTVTVTPAFQAGQVIDLTGSRTVHRRVGMRAAVADLLGGRLGGQGGFGDDLPAILSGTASSPGTASCTDSGDVTAGLTGSVAHRTELIVALDDNSFGFGFGVGDPLRTRCAGPGLADVAGGRALARAAVSLAQFAAPTITINLTNPGGFTAAGYSGSRSGQVTVTLARRTESGGTHVERIPRFVR